MNIKQEHEYAEGSATYRCSECGRERRHRVVWLVELGAGAAPAVAYLCKDHMMALSLQLLDQLDLRS